MAGGSIDGMRAALGKGSDSLLKSKGIAFEREEEADTLTYKFSKQGATAEWASELMEKLIASLIKDLRSADNASSKIVCTKDSEGIELDFSSYKKETFQVFMEQSMHTAFPESTLQFAEDPNTKMVLEKLVVEYSKQFTNPTFITNFPALLTGGADNVRVDLTLLSKRVMSCVTSPQGDSVLTLLTTSLAGILVHLMDASEINQLLPPEWGSLEEMPETTLEVLQDRINDWYRGKSVSERKASYVLSTVGNHIIQQLKSKLSHLTETPDALWKLPYVAIRQSLEMSMAVCEKWQHICKTLTTVDWSEWQGPAHHDAEVAAINARLFSVLRLRSTFEQLSSLLTKQELVEMRKTVEQAWESLAAIEIFDVSNTKESWESAVKLFEQKLEPMEQRSASRLRQELSNLSSNTQALLQGFVRYRDMISRPTISTELCSERDTLLAKLSEKINSYKSEFENKNSRIDNEETDLEDKRLQAGRNMPSIMNNLVWSRQLRRKIEYTTNAGKSLLSDLARYDQFEQQNQHLLSELKDYESETFLAWISNIQESIAHVTKDSGSLTLTMEGRIMEIAKKDGRLMVNFSEKLVELIREVRQLLSLGYEVPSAIQKVAQDALRFYRNATVLKQVANFYNTMDRQVIPSTITLLEKPIAAFENVVKGKGSKGGQVSWGDKKDVDTFTRQLKDSAEVLTRENRRLRKVHEEFVGLVKSLMDIDLVKHIAKWKAALKEMRQKFADLEKSGFKNTDPWKRHWDHQLYKVLEFQYQQGLETLNESLPEFHVSLCFKQGQIQFDPIFERIREHYYRNIRDFIAIPMTFTGVGVAEIFKFMTERNEAGIETVFTKTEQLFGRLAKVRRKYKEYVVLGLVDIEKWVDCLEDVQDWEKNYRMLKIKGKEIGALEDTIRIDCFQVSTIPIKATIEDQLSRLGQALKDSLKRAAEGHLVEIEQFLNDAIEKLNESPTTLEDIGKASEAYQQMKERQAPIQRLMKTFEEKAALYKKHQAGSTLDGSKVKARLGAFDDLLKAHEQMMAEKIERLRTEVSRDIEKYFKELDCFSEVWKERKPRDMSSLKDGEAIASALQFIKSQQVELNHFDQRGKGVLDQCKYFNMDPPDMQVLDTLKEDIGSLSSVWELYEHFTAEVNEFKEENWYGFRSKVFKFDDLCVKWKETLKEKPTNDVVIYVRSQLDLWSVTLPLFKFCSGEGMTLDHWAEMFRYLEIDRHEITPEKLTFGHFLDRVQLISQNEKNLKGLHAKAQGEIQIREALAEIRAWAHESTFELTKPQNCISGKVMLIKDWKELLTHVGDNQSLLGSLKDSPYYGRFAGEAASWEQKFVALDDYLHLLMQIQRKWVYLEPIFARGALPQEQPRFRRVDKTFMDIMREVESDPRVIELSTRDIGTSLRSILEQLDRCQKALNEYLEQKRDKFPRFYFIGDDDLLEILGQSQNPNVIQTHLKKLFSGIHRVQFDDNQQKITAMVSIAGEIVPLVNEVAVTAEVESWLAELDREMKVTLIAMLWGCVKENDLFKFPSQLLCLSELIHWTQKSHLAIKQMKLSELKADLAHRLKTNTQSKPEDAVTTLKMKAIIMDLIHSIDVADQLITHNVKLESDWYWQKQLRFYLREEANPCKVHMVDAAFDYTFEYQGNSPKLVHTPLTDKCYLTLTQGMHLGYGGNPYGPAGTGKTESVKALGNAMGRQVLVFNCDEGIDFKSMGRIFVGLVKCGAWGCFDEFNRLKEDQLSAISQMIQVIQAAIKNKEPECELLSRKIDVNHNAGIFVTLNPAGKGYGGRSKLPDNLKQLFREVAMSVPDLNLIAETILLSEGFVFAAPISKMIVTTFTLSKQLLSAQQHYDWGLRAIKTCLSLCGNLISKWHREYGSKGIEQTIEIEQELVIQSLRVNTLSKLAFDDTRLFNSLIADVFPGVSIKEIEYEELLPAVNEAIKDAGLQRLDNQVQKVLQLYEALNQRMGVVIVGPSGSGKSTLLSILRSALEKLKIRVPLHVMNPKAMPRTQLLGNMDTDTREWTDGVLTAAARMVVKEPTDGTATSWILCDGDVDPEWVESLNSVLDDNKLLTMPNGERIQFGPNVNFIFETHSLRYASPATVSRVGMIFLSEEDVDPKSAVSSWLAKQPEAVQPALQLWMEEYFYKAVNMLLDMKGSVVETTRMGIVNTGLSQLSEVSEKTEFTIGLIRGLGSLLPPAEREDYARSIFDLTGERAPRGSLLDAYTLDGKFVKYDYDPGAVDLTLDDLREGTMVRTCDVQRDSDIIKTWVSPGTERPFLLVGPEGCGKSSLVLSVLKEVKSVRIAVIHCSAQTEGIHVQQKLQQMCARVSTAEGPALRPRDCERLVLLLKDINLPKPDSYGTVQVHSFLQQIILYNGFYDKDLEWIRVERVQVICTMNPSGSVGRYDLAPRFVAIISVLSISYPSKENLTLIYTEFMQTLLSSPQLEKNSGGWSSGKGSDLARVMCAVYAEVKKRWTVDDASHYVFNPRDLTGWALNLLRYDVENNDLADIVYYEGQRTFADRLTKTEHRKRVNDMLSEQLSNVLGYTRRDREGDRFFTSWLSRTNLQSVEYRDYKKNIQQYLVQHEREIKSLDLVVLPEILGWISRVDRVLSSEGGSLLLCGRSGVGRREVVSLCAYALRMQLIELKMGRDYGLKEFKTEIKSCLFTAGVKGEPVVLLIEDHNMVHTGFLEIINSLLAGGESPGLYTQEELDPILAPLKEIASSEGFMSGLYQFFVHRVRKYLHIAVSMDPTSSDYEYSCQSNPSLYTRAQVMWMGTWSTSGMKRVPELVLKEIVRDLQPKKENKEDKDKDESKTNGEGSPRTVSPAPPQITFDLVGEVLKIHNGLGYQSTPRVFRYFLDNFKKVWHGKVSNYEELRSRLQNGLAKLQEAQMNVDVLKKEAEEKKEVLSIKQKEADNALTEIQQKMEEAGKHKANAETLKSSLSKESEVNATKKAAIEKEIAQIEPVLASAREAVGSIKSDNLNEIRCLQTPPAAIRDVLEGVLCLMDHKDTSWLGMKKFLSIRGVKDRILNFEASDIKPEVRENVNKLLQQKPQSFKHEVIIRASVAAAPLAAWVRANIEYSAVLEKIQPLQTELDAAEEKLKSAQHNLQKAEKSIRKLEDKVEELRKNFSTKTAQAAALQEGVQRAEAMLASAKELLGKLSGENTRWGEQVADINADFVELPKRCLMAAGFLTYLSKSSEDVREEKVQEWCNHLGTEKFSLTRFMRRERDILQYKAEGLPADELSMQNAIMLLDATQTPLFIDPASQATKWLREHLNRRPDVHTEYTTPADERFAHTLELAVRFGKTLIVAECDGIVPLLYPIMRRDLISQGPKKVVPIGDKLVDWQDTFKLYLVTRQCDLTLPPDAQALTSEVNFSITREGLEGQLLGITINSEQPDLEKQKQANLEKEDTFKSELASLEEKLLEKLSQAEGSLLENTALVEALTKIKTSAAEITEAVTKLNEDTAKMDKERDIYRPFAKLGSKLFFLMSDMPRVNHMYQFGLPQFVKTFAQVLSVDKDVISPEEKIKSLSELLLQEVFMLVSRGLFKDDRLLFGMHVVQGVASSPPYDSLFSANEWKFFTSLADADTHAPQSSDVPSWVDVDSVAGYLALKRDIPDLERKLQTQSEADTWYRWMQATTPEAAMPSHLTDVSSFQKLILVQIFRPDRLTAAMDAFVRSTLTLPSLTPPEVHMNQYADITEPTESILIVITPGADPSVQVEEMAFATIGRNNFVQIAMGGGQCEEAMMQLRRCALEGKWLLLKNLHLVIDWVSSLEKELNSLNPHPQFRLWLTTESHPLFPTVLATTSLKVTFEAPPGIKKSLLRTYEHWDPVYLKKQSPLQCQILFNLAWFHGLVLERRTYVPQGWTKFYEFSPADLRSAADVILAQSNDDTPDWPTIYGVLENAIYGGRMDNDFDVHLLKTYLQLYFNDDKLSIGGKKPQPISKGVNVPLTCNQQQFLDLIQQLPEMDYPATFGLPANSDRTVQREKVRFVLQNLVKLREVVDVLKLSKAEWGDRLTPIILKWTTMCTPNAGALQKKPHRKATPGPVEGFVFNELYAAQELVETVQACMEGIERTVNGVSLITAELQRDSAALLSNTVPDRWQQFDCPLTVDNFFTSLVTKAVALASWLDRAQNNTLLSSPLRLSDLLRPKTFLNALRQQSSKASGISVVNLRLASSWNGPVPGASISVAVEGLQLQGAKWNSGSLQECLTDDPSWFRMPDCHISWISSDAVSEESCISVPLYMTRTRESSLCEISIPCKSADIPQWTLCGLALVV